MSETEAEKALEEKILRVLTYVEPTWVNACRRDIDALISAAKEAGAAEEKRRQDALWSKILDSLLAQIKDCSDPALGERDPDAYDCPIHGQQDEKDCPRC